MVNPNFHDAVGAYSLQILHASNINKNGFKTRIAAEYSGIKVELATNFEMGVSNHTPEFLQMNPLGKVWNDFLTTIK